MPAPRTFYVTAVDGSRVYFLAGPYATARAEVAVESARAVACDPTYFQIAQARMITARMRAV